MMSTLLSLSAMTRRKSKTARIRRLRPTTTESGENAVSRWPASDVRAEWNACRARSRRRPHRNLDASVADDASSSNRWPFSALIAGERPPLDPATCRLPEIRQRRPASAGPVHERREIIRDYVDAGKPTPAGTAFVMTWSVHVRSQKRPLEQADTSQGTAALLQRYDRPGPRYTSYPTAVEFTDRFDERLPRAAGGRRGDRRTSRCRCTCTCRSARRGAPTAAA